MDFSFEHSETSPDVTITLSGRTSPVGFQELVRALRDDPRTRPDMLILIDVSALDVSTFAEEEMREAVDPVAEYDWMQPARAVALVAPGDAGFRAATMWRAHLGGDRSRRKVFRSREEALAWLTEQRGTG